MKIVRDTKSTVSDTDNHLSGSSKNKRYTWKILVVDDEPDVRTLTRICLRDFGFANRDLELIEAESAKQAISELNRNPDIAVALIDVVMETDDAGLKLVQYIRQQLGNSLMRIIIRTGQPGLAPERQVIDNYDIDDYKDKTELTATKLYTTVRLALKAYRDLQTINANRVGLERVLQSVPSIYHLEHVSMSNFFDGILTQVIGLCQLTGTSHIGTLEGVVTTINNDVIKIQACTQQFVENPRFSEIHDQCIKSILYGDSTQGLRGNAEILPLTIASHPVGYIYIEPIETLSEIDRSLIQVFAKQCSQALENYELHTSIIASFESAIDMLAEIAEYKDKATGGHVNRLDFYTRLTALTMGIDSEQAKQYGKASRLHDVGKVGIPDYILSKNSKLTTEEFEIIKKHTTLGASILGHDPAFKLAQQIALSHHERWDGKGYPRGIPAEQLPIATRIVSVGDVFDALICWRPYKRPWPIERARAAIAEGSGSQFDPDVVNAFLQVLDSGGFDSVIEQATQNF